MAKLYSVNDSIATALSIEDFSKYHQTSSVISQEALSDYLYKLKDSFSTVFSTILNTNNDKIVTDVLATKFETKHVASRLKFIDVKELIVSKPENFSGKYIDYTKDLIAAASVLAPNTEITLNNLKLAVASFINEYKEENVYTVYGATYFKESKVTTEVYRKKISKYFPHSNASVKSNIGNLLKSLSDIDHLYNDIQKLDSLINLEKIEKISKLAHSTSDLIDSLIDHNVSSGILLKNNENKKQLIEAVHIAASEVELLSYLYSNTIFFYSAFKTMSDAILANRAT